MRWPSWSRISEHVSSELAAALTLTGRSADALLGLSRELARIPTVLAALLSGRIDRARAVVFASELSGLGDVAAAAVAAAFCGVAGSMTTGQLRTALRAMVLAVDPDATRRRAEKGRSAVRVETWQEGSGNAALTGRELPATEVIAADRRIVAIAAALKEAGAAGGMDQLRAAVFTALLTGRDLESLLPQAAGTGRDTRSGVQSPPGPGMPGPAVAGSGKPGLGLAGLAGSVNLTMPASAWLGLSDAPGEVAGLGPLDAVTCRELAARLAAGPGTRWCVTLTGADGRAVAHACARSRPGCGPDPGPLSGRLPEGADMHEARTSRPASRSVLIEGSPQVGEVTRPAVAPQRADRWISRAATATVAGLAGIAGAISYSHMRQLADAHGETGWHAHAFPPVRRRV